MDDSPHRFRMNENWLSILIWAALLIILFLTSSNGLLVGFGGNVRDFYTTFFALNRPQNMNPVDNNLAIGVAVVTLLTAIALVYQLFLAWGRFVDLTNLLMIAYAEQSEPGDHNPLFFELLNFKEPEKDSEDEVRAARPDESIGSIIGDILKAIAVCWVIIILTPGLIMFLTTIIR